MDKELVRRSGRMLAGIGATAGLYAVCPPAGIVLGFLGFIRGARRFAQGASPDAAREMFMGCGTIYRGGFDLGDRCGSGADAE
jgi:hypothetical protein